MISAWQKELAMKTIGVISSFVVIVAFLVFFFYPFTSNDTNVSSPSTTIEPNAALTSVDKPIDSAHPNQSNIIKQQIKEDNLAAAELGLETDPELLAEIEKDMQFSEAPEGDVSYMSPEAETPQLLDEAFPGVAPDPHLTMPGNISPEDMNTLSDIGEPLEKNTKMDDLPRH